jgi:hypothetical protein
MSVTIRLLVSAIAALPNPGHGQNKTLIEALYTLLMVSFFGGRAELWPPFYTTATRLRPLAPHLLEILARTFRDPARLARPEPGRRDSAIDRLRTETSIPASARTASNSAGYCRRGRG